MRRDHSVAKTQARSAWQREKAAFERQHRAKLQAYVETRLALAKENALLNFMREEQLARATAGSQPDLIAQASGTAQSLAATAKRAAGVWVVNPSRPTNLSQTPPISATQAVEQLKHIAREVPKRTQQVLAGNDELVETAVSHGMPKGLSVFLALLMLHVPSLTLASLVTGLYLVRGNRQRSGVIFLSIAAALGLVMLFVLPW